MPKNNLESGINELVKDSQLSDAFNNSGLPQYANADVNKLSKNDIRTIKNKIAENDAYYKSNWKNNPQRKALVDVVNNYAETYRSPSLYINEPSLKDRFDKYIKYGFSGKNVDKWNKEIEDIESQMPFKDKAEHDKWLDMSAAWKGEPEWLDMTYDIIKRRK